MPETKAQSKHWAEAGCLETKRKTKTVPPTSKVMASVLGETNSGQEK